MKGWSIRGLWQEATRNVTSTVGRTLVVAVAVCGIVGGLTWVELATTGDLLAFQDEFLARGGSVAIVDAEGLVSASRCDALARRSEVVASGGMTRGGSVEVLSAPRTAFQTAWATPGAFEVWAADPPRGDDWTRSLFVGNVAAEELGIRDGSVILVAGEEPQQVTVIDVEARNSQAARWLISPVAPAGMVDQCWVEYAPADVEAGMAALEVAFADAGDTMAVRRAIRLGEFGRDPVAELADRPQRSAWVIAGLLLALLAWLATWFQRSEIGLYRAVGTPTAALWLLGQIEAFVVMIPAACAGFLWAAAGYVATTDGFPIADQLGIAVRTAAATLLVALIVAPLAWPSLGRGQIAAQLKDR